MATKKTLLNEATVRRFMKLAELEPLASPFLENAPASVIEEEEPTPEEAEYDDAAFEAGEEAADDEDAELELDLGTGEEAEALPEGDMQTKVKEFFDAVAEAATEILGVDTEVESDTGEIEDVAPMDVDTAEEETLDVADADTDVDVALDDVELEEEQGYDDREDESLGMADGPEKDKEQSEEDRREERYGKWRKRGREDRGASLEEKNDRMVEEITRRVVQRLLDV